VLLIMTLKTFNFSGVIQLPALAMLLAFSFSAHANDRSERLNQFLAY